MEGYNYGMENLEKEKLDNLNKAVEKMYEEHNLQVVTLSRMFVAMARVLDIDPALLAKKIREDSINEDFSKKLNVELTSLENSSQ